MSTSTGTQQKAHEILSFSIKREDAERFKRQLKKGERSKLLQWFVRMFLEGRIDLTTGKRTT